MIEAIPIPAKLNSIINYILYIINIGEFFMQVSPKFMQNYDGNSTKNNNVTIYPNTYILVPHGGWAAEKYSPIFIRYICT